MKLLSLVIHTCSSVNYCEIYILDFLLSRPYLFDQLVSSVISAVDFLYKGSATMI